MVFILLFMLITCIVGELPFSNVDATKHETDRRQFLRPRPGRTALWEEPRENLRNRYQMMLANLYNTLKKESNKKVPPQNPLYRRFATLLDIESDEIPPRLGKRGNMYTELERQNKRSRNINSLLEDLIDDSINNQNMACRSTKCKRYLSEYLSDLLKAADKEISTLKRSLHLDQ